ncbi:kinase-like domain-containing protein [Boletus edulis]|nr:kinase-like domain-containing protein [Boletus edulis]
MSSVVEDLGTIPGVEAYLQDKPQFAARTVEKLVGGHGNFTYRIYLHRAFAGRQTLVLKYAPPYAPASNGRFPLDQKRQLIEVQALRLAGRLSAANVPAFITVPAVHLFDEEKHVFIMDDAGEDCRTLKELLIEESFPQAVSEQIGRALGEFIIGVHTWNQNPDTDLTLFANSQVGKYLSALITYGRLESTLTGKDDIPTLSDPLLGIPEAKMATISKLVGRRQQEIYATSASDPMTHGDLWPGNLVVSLRRGTDGNIEGVEKLYVLDWELGKTGLPGLDLGQFCAEMYTLSEFYPTRRESTQTIIGSFLGTYGERRGKGKDIELARIVMSHIGAHLVTWTPRVSSWSGRQKTREVVEKGVEMLVLGEEGTESSLRESIVRPLL